MAIVNAQWGGGNIKQDASYRLVTDSEKSTWNNKAEKSHNHSISEITDLEIELKRVYAYPEVRTPNTSFPTLASLISFFINTREYYNGYMPAMSFPELPTQSWVYVVKWANTFNNCALVEIYKQFTNEYKYSWLTLSTNTFSEWITK